MCEPTSITFAISLAITAITSIAQHKAQESAAKANLNYQEAQGRAHNKAMLQTADSAIREQVEQSAAERTAQMQEQEATGQQIFDLQTERLRRQGEAVASSQASGTSLDMLMADYHRVEAQKKDVMKEQMRMQGVQHDFAVSGMRDQTDSRIKAQQGFIGSPVSFPDWGLTALGIGADMAGKMSSYDWKTTGGTGGTGGVKKKPQYPLASGTASYGRGF